MTVAQLKKRYNTLKAQINSGEISAEDAKDKAIILLADAMDLQNVVEANSDDAYLVARIISCLDELANTETVSL